MRMRRLLRAAIVALLLIPATLAAELPIVGVSRSSSTQFEHEIEAFETADRAAPPGSCRIVFTGSSSMRFWHSLDVDMAPMEVLNRGFGGSQISDVNFYFDRILTAYHPKAIVFYAGENDLNAGKSTDRVISDFLEFMALKTNRLGNIPVFFISIKPTPLRFAQFAAQSEVNTRIRAIASMRMDLKYVDVVPVMLEHGQPKDIFAADRLHMTPVGYALWTKIVRTALEGAAVSNQSCPR